MNNPMNRLRRGSMFEATFSPHSVESPLMSPLTSPLSSPLTAPINSALSDIASPSHANLFSPNLNDAFSGLVVLDEFNFETPGFATPSLENILDFKIKPISTSTEGILEDNLRSNTGDSSLSAGATTPTSSNSDFSSSNGVGNASNNSPSTPDNNSQELPIVTGHTVAAGMNVSSVKQPQQQSQQVSVGAGMSMEGMSNSDFLFDIAQFLDSTSSQLNN